MTGHYTDIYFPSKNVRCIVENDNIDIAPFKNILNDMYAKDEERILAEMKLLKEKLILFYQ